MEKFNLFRVYNSRTYEKVESLGKNCFGDYYIKNNSTEYNDDVILCRSFKLYDYKGNWIIIFEGDILEITFKKIGKSKDIKLSGKVIYENNTFLLDTIQGKIDLTQSDNIITFEIIDNFFNIENKLYKIKELFDNYFISSFENFNVYIKEDSIIISSNILVFEYIIKEKRLVYTLLEDDIDMDNDFQCMLLKGCIDYLRKEIDKIWIDEEMD
jgi:hypothetical protein